MTAPTTPPEVPALPGSLALAEDRILLDGRPQVLLCSSVFPFRIPSAQWEHRLRLVRESGYRMVDVYVHWGFHEEVEGTVDLTSPERDLARFLRLAAEQGLLVMARPGPYICSETDGGGLPWWLHAASGQDPAPVRTTDPRYLEAVDRWFGAVLPVLADAQVGRGGPVALVQLENELDFFDCPDPGASLSHLAGLARSAGIEVPLIACAGQGDLAGASGDAEGVVPTVNLYPDDASATLDEEARYYRDALAARGLPLMVTETNRVHRTLRREILAGARLVAPYLQTSGFDHLVQPSAGNWGDPGNLMTHDYDFGGYVSPDGRRRPEYDAAITLAATLDAWGERLAAARPVPLAEVPFGGPATGGALALPGGGWVVGPAEVAGLSAEAELRPAGGDGPVRASVEPLTCPFWALDVPLDPWGVPGTLAVATAELTTVDRGPDQLLLEFTGGPGARVDLLLEDEDGGTERLRLDGPGEARSTCSGHPVRVVLREPAPSRADAEPVLARARGTVAVVPGVPGDGDEVTERDERRDALPDGRLRTEHRLPAGTREVLLLGAADLVRCTLGDRDLGLAVPHGAPLSHRLGPAAEDRTLMVTTEVWGRANFDDARRPALRLGAGRGPGRVLAVLEQRDLTDLWAVRALPDRRGTVDPAAPPLRSLGGWSSARPGHEVVSTRALPALPEGTVPVLRLRGLAVPIHVQVDDGPERLVVPDVAVLALPSGASRLTVRAPHVPGGLLDGVELLVAVEAGPLRSAALPAAALAAAVTAVTGGQEQDLPEGPLPVEPGRPLRVRLDPPAAGEGALLEIDGRDVLVTVVAGGRRVSRHVLGEPATSGGDPRRSWLPAGWAGADGGDAAVLLLVEALRPEGGIFGGVRRASSPR